jgi:hypothetical protein
MRALYHASLIDDTLSRAAYASIRQQWLSLRRAARTIGPMAGDDLSLAQQQLESLKELFGRHSGEADARALRWLVTLCRGTGIDDEYCRSKLATVEELGAEMFTHGGHRRFSADSLRQRILDALELFESRLYSLAMLRSPRQLASSIARFEVHPV